MGSQPEYLVVLDTATLFDLVVAADAGPSPATKAFRQGRDKLLALGNSLSKWLQPGGVRLVRRAAEMLAERAEYVDRVNKLHRFLEKFTDEHSLRVVVPQLVIDEFSRHGTNCSLTDEYVSVLPLSSTEEAALRTEAWELLLKGKLRGAADAFVFCFAKAIGSDCLLTSDRELRRYANSNGVLSLNHRQDLVHGRPDGLTYRVFLKQSGLSDTDVLEVGSVHYDGDKKRKRRPRVQYKHWTTRRSASFQELRRDSAVAIVGRCLTVGLVIERLEFLRHEYPEGMHFDAYEQMLGKYQLHIRNEEDAVRALARDVRDNRGSPPPNAACSSVIDSVADGSELPAVETGRYRRVLSKRGGSHTGCKLLAKALGKLHRQQGWCDVEHHKFVTVSTEGRAARVDSEIARKGDTVYRLKGPVEALVAVGTNA